MGAKHFSCTMQEAKWSPMLNYSGITVHWRKANRLLIFASAINWRLTLKMMSIAMIWDMNFVCRSRAKCLILFGCAVIKMKSICVYLCVLFCRESCFILVHFTASTILPFCFLFCFVFLLLLCLSFILIL